MCEIGEMVLDARAEHTLRAGWGERDLRERGSNHIVDGIKRARNGGTRWRRT